MRPVGLQSFLFPSLFHNFNITPSCILSLLFSYAHFTLLGIERSTGCLPPLQSPCNLWCQHNTFSESSTLTLTHSAQHITKLLVTGCFAVVDETRSLIVLHRDMLEGCGRPLCFFIHAPSLPALLLTGLHTGISITLFFFLLALSFFTCHIYFSSSSSVLVSPSLLPPFLNFIHHRLAHSCLSCSLSLYFHPSSFLQGFILPDNVSIFHTSASAIAVANHSKHFLLTCIVWLE